MTPKDGNGFVRCVYGHRHWGLNGAAGLLLTDPERGVLLQRRAWWVHHGRTWALPGGAVEAGETPREAATREAREEAAVPLDAVRTLSASLVDHGNWRYTTVLAAVTGPVGERVANAESAELRWVPPDEVAGFRLHSDFASAWPGLRSQLGRELVLIVDGANVVGSRPDGWWRDRLAAAARLRDKLAALSRQDTALTGVAGPEWSWWPRVRLVVEGQARGLDPVPGVEVIAAPADGDATIVATAQSALTARPDDHVLVVTADRELRTRVETLGAMTLGPATLLATLDALT
ncbi:NUDIX hydrolase [Amycolatopsis sp. H20-H5]|uniref:NUDIX hydrolase n=1 Tax=Amycolatopsis sp. H20-H5 TaxID=3046309 RepID=UPI002DBDD16D|nr:NUDIX domain-containing protein [Amycolatopsis sp. H20-H5]MEC3973930.1 NUDIX domain-containing protein [Amycolatopsis sp. H20-H5]